MLLAVISCTSAAIGCHDIDLGDKPATERQRVEHARHSHGRAKAPAAHPPDAGAEDSAPHAGAADSAAPVRADAKAPDATTRDAAPGDANTSAEPTRDASIKPSANATIPLTSTVPRLRIAFIGDQGIGPEAAAVLSLVAREKAHALIHAGDLAYDLAIPGSWDAQIDAILGRNFPYFVAIGNHDVGNWEGPDGFATAINARLARIPEAHCEGELGIYSMCKFRGLAFLLSGVGTIGTDHETFIDNALAHSDAAFQLCVWHKNQHDMQVGAKPDEVGWRAYQICAAHGAPIITGHEHSYARTRALTALGERDQAHGATGDLSDLVIGPNRTVVVVTGLGGHSMRIRTEDHLQDTWWSSIYAQNYQLQNGQVVGENPQIQYGALFIDFNIDGDPYKAHAYFKTVDNQIKDDFTLRVPNRR